jgi:hypothetical protein
MDIHFSEDAVELVRRRGGVAIVDFIPPLG